MKKIKKEENWKQKWYTIIFEHHTKEGKWFDEILLVLILFSVIVVVIDSMKEFHDAHSTLLFFLEWVITILFTIEYVIRIIVTPKKKKYIFSFYGIIDFISIIPTYLSILFIGTQFLVIIRILRLMRIFRILKLAGFTSASRYLMTALKHSREKIIVFFSSVLILVTIMGTVMYIVEGPEAGFVNIPVSIYWAIVTITTVGFGDITPSSPFGQFIASLLMLTGYAIIAVPTGIITAEMSKTRPKKEEEEQNKVCTQCTKVQQDNEATFCSKCGTILS